MNTSDTFLTKFLCILKKIFIWIFSNLLWTIITFIIPISIIIPNIIKIIKTNTIDYYKAITSLVLFISVEIVLIIICISVKKLLKTSTNINSKKEAQLSESEKITQNSLEEISYYDNLDYYFEEYNKELTIYKNGHGIMIDSFTLIINNIDSIQKFKREINLHDAQANTILPKLSVMKKTKLSDRFSKFGFWCKCINNDKLIQSVSETYWSDNSDEIDEISKNDPMILKWILKMNTSSIKIGEPYKVVYVISIPRMFPINNGEFSESIANIKHTRGRYTTQFSSKHLIKKFSKAISFENGLPLYRIPNAKIISPNSSKNIAFVNGNNIIYDKYIFSAQNIGDNDIIEIEWYFKENKKKGGIANEENN